MSMTKRSDEFEETMRQEDAVRDPHEELAIQVWVDDGGALEPEVTSASLRRAIVRGLSINDADAESIVGRPQTRVSGVTIAYGEL